MKKGLFSFICAMLMVSIAIGIGSCHDNNQKDLTYDVKIDGKVVLLTDTTVYVEFKKEFSNVLKDSTVTVNNELAETLISYQKAIDGNELESVGSIEGEIIKIVSGGLWYAYNININADITEAITGAKFNINKTLEHNWNDSIPAKPVGE
jgi:hypothetical protein